MSVDTDKAVPLISRWPKLDEGGHAAARLIAEHVGSGTFSSPKAFMEAFDDACVAIGSHMPWAFYERDAIVEMQEERWVVVEADGSVTVSLPPEWADEARRRLAA